MDYDIAIATRNRQNILPIALRTFAGQTRQPRRVIVVDSSDEPERTKQLVDAFSQEHDIETDFDVADPNPAGQRNLALEYVQSPVVFFPDDDALWYPEAAEHVMSAYEADLQGVIGGISLTETRVPPPDSIPEIDAPSRGDLKHRLIYRLSPVRDRVERLVCPSPLWLLTRQIMNRHTHTSAALDWGNVRLIPFQLGFRMTFRTEAIRRHRFDETLLYAYEDIEASAAVGESYRLAAVDDALVFHHRMPGSRGDERVVGFRLLMNVAYIVCRHSAVDSMIRGRIMRYCRMRHAQYLLRACVGFSPRQRLIGSRFALRHLPQLLDAPPEEVPQAYLDMYAKFKKTVLKQ